MILCMRSCATILFKQLVVVSLYINMIDIDHNLAKMYVTGSLTSRFEVNDEPLSVFFFTRRKSM